MSETHALNADEIDDFIIDGSQAIQNAYVKFLSDRPYIAIIPVCAQLSLFAEFIHEQLITTSAAIGGPDIASLDSLVMDMISTLIACHRHRQEGCMAQNDEASNA